MPAIYESGKVIAQCPYCNTRCTFMGPNGTIQIQKSHKFNGQDYNVIQDFLYTCGGCGRGALVNIHHSPHPPILEAFHPAAVERAPLPNGVPDGIVNEFREAELCAAHGAYRAASALLRSTLEKTLKENGFTKGNLKDKIGEAATDGIITAAHKNKADDDIRVVANEVVHDDWRVITPGEIEIAHKYAQRILEDFYDVRDEVEKILTAKKAKAVAVTAASGNQP